MRFRTCTRLVVLAAFAAPALLSAEAPQAALQVTVTVTRQCQVTTGQRLEVSCTRASGAVIQTGENGRAAQPTPLVTTSPGVTSASVPLSSQTSVVTVQF